MTSLTALIKEAVRARSSLHYVPGQAALQERAGQTSRPSSADFWLPRLPGQPADLDLRLYAGHLNAYPSSDLTTDAKLFFLLAKAAHPPAQQRLIVWFQGGPGCSSMDGALMEIGPVRIASNNTLVASPSSASEYATVLFVDQPAGTGFSYINAGEPATELTAAANRIVDFLVEFYVVFPELAQVDLYLAGESFAGVYIPHFARAIKRSTLITAPLRGMIIGNGWLDPRVQYEAYWDQAVAANLMQNRKARDKASSAMQRCRNLLYSDDPDQIAKGVIVIQECEDALNAILSAATKTVDGQRLCVNVYNTLEWQQCGADYPPEVAWLTPYLQSSNVISRLHASSKSLPWTQCNDTVTDQFWAPSSSPSVELLPELLDDVALLLYAGENDFMCGALGLERTIGNLTYQGARGFAGQNASDWYVNDTYVGRWTERDHLTFALISNASHMAARERPMAINDMLQRFLNISLLAAAGFTATHHASSVGNQTARKLGLTRPNGTSWSEPTKQDDKGFGFGDELDNATGLVKDRERYYGPRRSAALVIAVLVLGTAIYFGVRALAVKGHTKKQHSRSTSAASTVRSARSRTTTVQSLNEAEEGAALLPVRDASPSKVSRV
ncbi:uncharacterized protein L969DRAFT_87580 [Mixia osmundae IAM 14324]|uniref:Pheromone-processing carboxypeptidase KEX1 n=1 Tax=Mixia osmundae (strain CBS 9802 / IAM 14324 / JCM 22182 / KY 12970) TaxID=764103 RepID=G7DVT7_MIXOS|nr:uncharacterized protein L969DRAFT_87580 [Mixia osmundae IAM 14324]KEI39622.1 hypothetical protein L969DRAFT_87580 [Mixia osmundae IAM 14324]GAA94697.1 hypothetical protein E5Q_01350 [Mixia osmundae IAM 14324]